MGDLGCQKEKIALTLVGTGESLNELEQIKGICHLRTCYMSGCSFGFTCRWSLRQGFVCT